MKRLFHVQTLTAMHLLDYCNRDPKRGHDLFTFVLTKNQECVFDNDWMTRDA
jgi:hypothetical protein